MLAKSVLANETRTRVEVAGATLSVQASAVRSGGPTLVFVPGWTMPGSIFDAQFQHFKATHSVVVIDPRGQGESSHAKEGYTLERRSQDIADVLEAMQLNNVVLIGWSLGVLESLHLVAAYPAARVRIRALVLVDNSVGEATPPKGDPQFFTKLRTQRQTTVQAFVKSMFKSDVNAAQISSISNQAQRMDVESSIALLSYPKPREYWRESLYAWEKPAAYFVTPKFFAQADAVKQKRRDIVIEKFPDAGHALFVDDAPKFNAALRAFLNAVPQ